MKVWSLPSIQSIKSFEDLRRFVNQSLTNFSQILSRGVGFGDNINCQIFEIDLIASTSVVLNHSLGAVPIGFLTIKTDQPLSILIPTADFTWTSTQVSIYATQDTIATIILLGS